MWEERRCFLSPCGLGMKPVYPSLTMTNKKVDKVEGRGVEGERTDQSGLQQGKGEHHLSKLSRKDRNKVDTTG